MENVVFVLFHDTIGHFQSTTLVLPDYAYNVDSPPRVIICSASRCIEII